MPTISYDNIHLILVETVPEFRPWYQKHLLENEDEVLPHVLFGEFIVFIKDICETIQDKDEDTRLNRLQTTLNHVLSFMELIIEAKEADNYLDNLIGVSFLENLHMLGSKANYMFLRQHAEPKLLRLLKTEEGFWLKPWLKRVFPE